MKIINIIIGLMLLALISCSNTTDPNYDQKYNELSSLEIKDAITLVNKWKFSNPEITSYITTTELKVVFPDGREINTSLPDDEMFVAVAPYITNTHSCATHYFSSCQGEMVQKELRLKVTDSQQQIIYDDIIKTMKNGFFEMWLPRNKSFTFHLEFEGKSSDITIESYNDSKTCITTGRLE